MEIEFHRVTLLEASDGQPPGVSGTVVDASECGRAWIIELDDPDAPVIYALKEICEITATEAAPSPPPSDHTSQLAR